MAEPIVESSTETVLNVARTGTIRVLHVDDDQAFLKVAKQCLDTQGEFEVDTASSVNEASEKLKKTDYDAIVCDYQMPGKDGLEFLEELRANGNNTPFIVFTGKGREEVAIKTLNLGADQYINKSGDPETIYGELAHSIRRAVKERHDEEQLLYQVQLIQSVSDAIIANDENFILTSWNQAAERMYGWKANEVIGRLVQDVLQSEFVGIDRAQAIQMLRETGKFSGEVVQLHRNGYRINVETNAIVLRGKNNQIIGYISVNRDITERRESEEKFRVLAEQSPNMIFMNKMGKVFYANKKCKEIVGYRTEELCSPDFNFLTLIAPESIDQVKSALGRHMEGEYDAPYECTLLTKEGKRITVIITTNLITYKGEKTILGIITDITERKKVEEEKSRLLHDLHERVKKLNCLYGMSRFFEKSDISLDNALQETADLLPPAMQYPDITCARVVVENREFSTKNFKETRWKLQADIKVLGKKDGSVEVRYLEEPPTIAEGPFLKEERHLIDAVAERLGKITERKKVEKTLRESEERFRAIFEGANDGILVADVETKRFFFANSRICEITGYSLEELLKLGVDDIHPKKDLPYVIDSFAKQMQGKLTLSKDIPVLRKDERVVYCDVNSRPMKIGSQEYLVGLFRDVTELKKAEEALKDAKQKWTSLTENTDDIVMIVDSEGTIQYINRTIPPYTPEETIGKTVYEYVPREQHDTLRSSLKKTFETGVPLSYVVSSNIPKIGTLWFETKIVPVKDDEKTVSAILISVDITKLRSTEERLKETNMKLVVTNEKLHVVGGLTRHDVRNKLSAVTGNAYLLRRKLVGDAKALEQLTDMEAAVRLVERIFEFAGIYEKLGTEQLVNIDVDKVVDEAASLFSDLKGVKVVNECHGLTVLADSLLTQLFYNLIDNSLKYGEKTRQIEIYYDTLSTDQLELVYEDDGVGIPDNMRSNLFKEGFTSGKGSGYGLFMIKRICEVYGWTIQETGVPGKGAKFVITIPRTNPNGKESYVVGR